MNETLAAAQQLQEVKVYGALGLVLLGIIVFGVVAYTYVENKHIERMRELKLEEKERQI